MGRVYRRKDSKNVWWIDYSVNGRRFREVGGKTKAHAAALLNKIEKEIFVGTHFPEKKQAGLTVEGLEKLWYEHRSDNKSIESDKARFETIREHFKAATPIASIVSENVEKLKKHLCRKKTRRGNVMAPASVNRHLALLRAALNLASTTGYFHRNPMAGIKFLAEQTAIPTRVCRLRSMG